MIVDCIADLHGHYPELEGGDLLIVAGDLTARDTPIEYGHFGCWMDRQKYEKKILISGNHDNYFERKGFEFIKDVYSSIGVEYLCDSGTEFEGMKIWGSPWTKMFPGMNPHCKAFTCDTEEELAKKWELIPENTNILITHGPSFGMLDKSIDGDYCGSSALDVTLLKLNLKLHVFGHIHEGYGRCHQGYLSENGESIGMCITDNNCLPMGHLSINCSHMNERYKPVNKPIRVIL